MKSSIITRGATLFIIGGAMAIMPLPAQSSTGTTTGHGSTTSAGAGTSGTAAEAGGPDNQSTTTQNGRSPNKSTLNNHAQGSANNETPTGGDNAERKAGASSQSH